MTIFYFYFLMSNPPTATPFEWKIRLEFDLAFWRCICDDTHGLKLSPAAV